HHCEEFVVEKEIVDPVPALRVPRHIPAVSFLKGWQPKPPDEVLPRFFLHLRSFIDPEPPKVAAANVLRIVEVTKGYFTCVPEIRLCDRVNAAHNRLPCACVRFLNEKLGIPKKLQRVPHPRLLQL